VTSLSVVVLEPGRKGFSTFGVGGEGLLVGPFGLQGAVESLDLAVLPRAVRFDEHLASPELCADVADRIPVSPRIVGHDPLDAANAVLTEVGRRAAQELSTSAAFLVGQYLGGQYLGVRQAGMVVNQ
jgi:hypothetical protein